MSYPYSLQRIKQISPPVDLLLAFSLFAFVTSVTPGPNGAMLPASGVGFCSVRSILHILGISCDFFIVVMTIDFDLGTIPRAYPVLYTILHYAGMAHLLYLAQKTATSSLAGNGPEGRGKPLNYWSTAAFQWVNSRAWVMMISAISTYAPLQGYFANVVTILTVFTLISMSTIGVQISLGSTLRNVLRDPHWLWVLNVGMVLLLAASLYPVLVKSHPV